MSGDRRHLLGSRLILLPYKVYALRDLIVLCLLMHRVPGRIWGVKRHLRRRSFLTVLALSKRIRSTISFLVATFMATSRLDRHCHISRQWRNRAYLLLSVNSVRGVILGHRRLT